MMNDRLAPIALNSTIGILTMSVAPADLRARLDVTPRADNRFLVVAESDELYRGSELPLDAEYTPRTVMVQFRGLPAGADAVSAEARDAGGRRLAVVGREVKVLPLAGSR
jgi:hypothetical protein